MFTGIVEEVGLVLRSGQRLAVASTKASEDSGPGASVAVNGVCLTVVGREPNGDLTFDLSEETLARSALGELAEGDPVNLERPVTLATRLGGHLVQGHVDGVGTVEAMEPIHSGGGAIMTVSVPNGLRRYVVDKGSIAVDGVSLTAVRPNGGRFQVALVPFTLEATTFGRVEPGRRVNLEVDLIAKYIEALTGRSA
jgi:riboflavin synthase